MNVSVCEGSGWCLLERPPPTGPPPLLHIPENLGRWMWARKVAITVPDFTVKTLQGPH